MPEVTMIAQVQPADASGGIVSPAHLKDARDAAPPHLRDRLGSITFLCCCIAFILVFLSFQKTKLHFRWETLKVPSMAARATLPAPLPQLAERRGLPQDLSSWFITVI